MKTPSINTSSTTIFAAIGLIGYLLPIQPAASQETETAKPSVPQEGVGGPNAIDVKVTESGVISRADLSLNEIVAGAADFTTLAAALRAAGLDKPLKEDGAMTLLAPDNAAFEALPEGVLPMLLKPGNVELLKTVLNYHLIPKKVMGSGFVPGELATSQGEPLTVVAAGEGKATIQGAGFGATNIEARNGVIHVVKAVLLPPSVTIEDYTPGESE